MEFDQSLTVWSFDDDTIVLAFGWRARSVTGPLCPINLKGLIFLKVDRFQTITALSYEPDIICDLLKTDIHCIKIWLLVSIENYWVNRFSVATICLSQCGIL